MNGFLERILQEIMKKNNTLNIRRLIDETIIPPTQRIILKIVGFFDNSGSKFDYIFCLKPTYYWLIRYYIITNLVYMIQHFYYQTCCLFWFLLNEFLFKNQNIQKIYKNNQNRVKTAKINNICESIWWADQYSKYR